MKKILALTLAVLMLLALVSCGSCGKDNPDDTTDDVEDTDSGEKQPSIEIPNGFTAFATTKTLYVNTTKLNVRSAPEVVDGNVIGAVNYGDKVTAVAENADWTLIKYNGSPAYVSSDYLTDEKPADTTEGTISTETDVPDSEFSPIGESGETVYVCPTDDAGNPVEGQANYYSAPNRSKKAGALDTGVELVRVAKTTEDEEGNGWSKLTYIDPETNKEATIYMRNSVVSTTKPTFETEAE